MSYPVYYVPSGDVLPVMFSSYAGSTGASATLSGLAVTDIEIYKDGGTTQRASDAGYTLLDTDGIDFDGVTGIHGFSIDTGDNTDAGFYTVGAWFHVVVSAVTVDTQTVSFIACAFRLMPAESVAGKPKVDVDAFGGTAGTFSGGRPEVNATHLAGTAYASADFSATMKASINTEADTALTDYGALKPTTAGRTLDVTATGEAGIDWGNIGSPTTVVDLSGTTVKTATDIATLIGAAGASLSAIPWNAAWDAEVESECNDALVGQNLDHLVKIAVDTNFATTVHLDSVLGYLADNGTTATFDRTTDSLEAVRDRGDSAWITATGFSTHSAADVWSAATRTLTALDEDSTTLDLDATIRAAVGLAAANLDTQLTTIDDLLDTEVAAIKAKTDQLTFTTANQVDATTVTMSAGSITAAALAADAGNEIADAVLDRNMATGTDSGSPTIRTMRQALRLLRNKASIAAGTLTVTKEDDTTSSWTAAVTTAAGDPITSIDPADA